MFGDLDFGEEGKTTAGTDPKIDANYFGEGSGGNSCLVVNWERTAEFKNENDR